MFERFNMSTEFCCEILLPDVDAVFVGDLTLRFSYNLSCGRRRREFLTAVDGAEQPGEDIVSPVVVISLFTC